jgi:hypothetical protein
MVPWNALPWNTIVILIGLSILLPSIFAILYIYRRRFEELGLIIGVFFLLLSSVSYGYLIPNEIIGKSVLPDNYRWEDQGNIHYWERNTVFSPSENLYEIPYQLLSLRSKREPIVKDFIGREVIHATYFDKDTTEIVIHDVIYDENDEVFRVISENEKVSEWYRVKAHLTNLEYVNVDAGRMGIPSHSERFNTYLVGWVESGGEENGKENVVLVRTMHRMNEGLIDGVKVSVWESEIFNTQITWHGESYICDETLHLTVNPKTGYVVHVYRHLVLSAHLSQFVKLYHPEALKYKAVQRFLKNNDPIGEAAQLIYETTDASLALHIAELKEIEGQMTFIPLVVCSPMFIIGVALIWRYAGRSYYWKRYRDLKGDEIITLHNTSFKNGHYLLKKVVVVLLTLLFLALSIKYSVDYFYQDDTQVSFEGVTDISYSSEESPIPPGSNRGIDSGRHVLEPIDEGAHKLSRREWWYFNVFFNDPQSDLDNMSMIISFNKMAFNDIRFLKRDNLFIILYEENGTSHNFGTLDKRRGTLTYDSPGVDISFENCWAKGQYPTWHVHVENKANSFLADFIFNADFLPVWVVGRSSNLAYAKYFAGDYYIPRCNVEGNISWNGNNYQVSGVGYHDHVWETSTRRIITRGWDWMNLHFDNGWEMYLSKFIFRTPRERYAAALIISPNNRNIVEFNKFSIDRVETATPEGLPLMRYPKKYHVEAHRDDMVLEMDIEMYSTCEIVWKIARTGMFEGPCRVSGTFSWAGHSVRLTGYGMSEVTRVKYIIERPRIIFN